MSTFSPMSGSPASNPPDTASGLGSDPVPAPTKPATKSKSKPRKRVNTAEKRHQHNAIERARRETLNSKFISLARLLPSLANTRRPSKSAIVNGSIAHLTYQRDQRLLAARLLKGLAAQHDELLGEVNEWRKANGFQPKETKAAWTDEMEEVCNVEKEVFGTFASMEGEDDDGDDETLNAGFDQIPAPLQTVNGLITPRSSTDLDAIAQSQIFNNLPTMTSVNPQPTPTVNGMNWSAGMSFPQTANVPFASFLQNNTNVSAGVDRSSFSSSPVSNNNQSTNVLTPPGSGQMLNIPTMDHTPSPVSSAHNSVGTSPFADESKNSLQAPNPWRESIDQMYYLGQGRPGNNAQAPEFQRVQSTPVLPTMSQQQQSYSGANQFAHLFAQAAPSLAAPVLPQQPPSSAAAAEAFINSLLPSQTTEQIQQWRKLAMTSGLMGMPQMGYGMEQGRPTVEQLRDAVRAGMGMGLGLAQNHHQQPPVPGF